MNKDKKPLSESHPELAKEANGWDPNLETSGSRKRKEWICSKKHIWSAPIQSRAYPYRGCPYCTNRKILIGFNDLETTHPEIAKEANGWDPKTVTFGSNKKMKWKCSKEHIWSAEVTRRTNQKSGCNVCSNRKVKIGVNDLKTVNPELAKEANGWDPATTIGTGSHKKFEWKCLKGHEWTATLGSRLHGKTNCPYCSNQKVLVGYNDLGTTHPELAKEANGWDPRKVIAGTSKKMAWRCSKGHNYYSTGAHRIEGKGCGFCSNSNLLEGFNDLASTHPELAKEANGWDPRKIIAGTNKKMSWMCSKGHAWNANVGSRAYAKKGCPFCSNQETLLGFNDLKTTRPDLAQQAHGWDPKTLTSGSMKNVDWICSFGHVWKANVVDRTKGNGCPVCSNKKVQTGFNDLATTNPELAKEAFGWDPKTVTYGQKRKFEWICENGHRWKATVNDRSTGYGCPSCANSGFDPNQNGYLYFLIQPIWEIYQIGITNFPKVRLKRHSKNGFELLELRGPMDGHTAQELETAILRYLKSQKADLSPDHVAGKFDGFSESWTIDSFQINSLKVLIDRTREAGY